MTPSEKLSLLAKDLTRAFPRSPRETLGGYVIAARAVDKCRAVLAGTAGDYTSGCPVDQMFLNFAGLTYEAFSQAIISGAADSCDPRRPVRTNKAT